MANQNDAKNGDSTSAVSSTEPGHIKLHIRTARLQKYITVEENISIKNVSTYPVQKLVLILKSIC